MIDLTSVIVRPVSTEKTVGSVGVYTFIVHPEATKPQIAAAVKEFYRVKDVEKVRVSNTASKTRRTRTGTAKKRANQKKAMVTLPKGETLNFNDFR